MAVLSLSEYPDGFEGALVNGGNTARIAAVSALLHDMTQHRDAQISGSMPNHQRHIPDDWHVCMTDGQGEARHYACCIKGEEGVRTIVVDDGSDKASTEYEVNAAWVPGQTLVRAYVDSQPFVFQIAPTPEGFDVRHRGCRFDVAVRTPRAAELAKLMPEKVEADTSNMLLCPMPGVIKRVLVTEGDEVQDGQALAVVEAMKMENTLRAEKKATVGKVYAGEGDNLAVDEVILDFVVAE